MIKVKKEQRKEIAFLFDGIEDSMVIAYLQGYMGEAYVDRFPEPVYGAIISGEYSFFGGDPVGTEHFLEDLFLYIKGDESVAIYSDLRWRDALLKVRENNPEEIERYRIVQKDYVFNESILAQMINALPQEYELKPFDREIYDKAMSEEWSMEFCETFESAKDYLDRGFGYAAMCGEEFVAGASTMTVYNGGTETQVAVRKDHRGRGLAIVCSAAFVLKCQRRGIRACWDAANLTSKHIALKLGFEDGGVYSTVHMKRCADPRS